MPESSKQTDFEWIPFYEELARKLADYRSRQPELVAILTKAGVGVSLEDQDPKGTKIALSEIDPFTFFSLFHKFADKNRSACCAIIARELELKIAPPKTFAGVPSAQPQAAWYFSYKYKRDAGDIGKLWDLFSDVLSGKVTDEHFLPALKVRGVGKGNLTQGLFRMAPRTYLPIDSQTRPFLDKRGIASDFETAAEYMEICRQATEQAGQPPYVISRNAWLETTTDSEASVTDRPPLGDPAPVFLPSSLNRILYGPPGTGKTYATKRIAVDICDGTAPRTRPEIIQRYNELCEQGRVEFVTFHQSFSYEDFVEGLRPVLGDDFVADEAAYECRPGVFRRICTAAEAAVNAGGMVNEGFTLGNQRVFKMSLGNSLDATENYLFQECMQNNCVLLGYGQGLNFTGCETAAQIAEKLRTVKPDIAMNDYNITSMLYLASFIKTGDLILISDGNRKFRAIGEVTGDYEFVNRAGKDSYCQKRAVRWLWKHDQSQPIELIFDKRLSQMTIYLMDQDAIKRPALARLLGTRTARAVPDSYVLVIDEINRANISKVFGELITLLEPDKRLGAPEALTVRLPYSMELFGVPKNLYVVGTMNTADRSIALLDTALRRRFDFEELSPDYNAILGTGNGSIADEAGQKIDLRRALKVINDRLEYLLGRDQRIGHGYLTDVRTFGDLNETFAKKILPLMQEYFYEDWAGIAKVLAVPKGVPSFISKRTVAAVDLFGAVTADDMGYAENVDVYTVASVFTPAMYRGLYLSQDDMETQESVSA